MKCQVDLGEECLLLFSVDMQREIEEGKSPAIQISDRSWNDESSGVSINMKPPTGVCF